MEKKYTCATETISIVRGVDRVRIISPPQAGDGERLAGER